MSTPMIVTIAVIVFLIVFVIIGWSKGFLRVILTTLSLVATMVVAAFLLTPVSNFLANNTSIEKSIEKKVEKSLGWDTEVPEGVNIDDIMSELPEGADVNDIASELPEGTDISDIDPGQGKDIAEEFLNNLRLPRIIKATLFNKTTINEYISQGIESLKQYVVERISSVALKIMTYVGLIIAIYIIIRILLLVSKLINSIPVVRGINRFFGAVVGFVEGAMILWLLCLIISLISQTELGIKIVDVIHQSWFLSYIYEQNLVLRMVNALITLF